MVYLYRPGECKHDKAGCESEQVCMAITKLKEKISLLHIQCIVNQPANANQCHSVSDIVLGSLGLENLYNTVPNLKELESC